MPLWTNVKPPHWVPDAVATNSGWADPDSGEVYVAIGGLTDRAASAISRIMVEKTVYKLGDKIKVYVHFSEPVTVTGTPRLTIQFNEQSRTADYAAGSESNVLTFEYTTQAGDDALVGEVVAVSPIDLNSGTLVDTNGDDPKDAVLTFEEAAYTTIDENVQEKLLGNLLGAVLVDVTKPTFSEPTIASSAHETHPVTADVLTLTLKANEAVKVTGSPRVTLTVNETTRYLTYNAAASTTTSLKFKYTVVAEDVATAGQLTIGDLTLNSGTILDAVGNAATLTFVAPDVSTWAVN